MESIFGLCDTISMGKRTTGGLIRHYRQVAGWTQRELAVRIGMTDRRITAWESQGEEPGRDALTKLARVFGVGIGDLVGDRQTIDALVDQEVDALLSENPVDPAIDELQRQATEIIAALSRFPHKLDRWIVYGRGLVDGIERD